MNKPRLLDLFCGAGGCSYGYHLASFEVVGVDIAPQPHYPFTFVQDDALHFLDTADLSQFTFIHASPPCQEYSRTRHLRNATAPQAKHALKLIQPVRERLVHSGLPWIIENVAFSDLPDALELCGSMFGLPIQRHRWFSSSHLLFAPGPCQHTDSCINPVGGKVRGYGALATQKMYTCKDGRKRKRESYLSLAIGRRAMGIDWMTMAELSQAIPPAYTEYIGKLLLTCIDH